jgi:hypothetical protein
MNRHDDAIVILRAALEGRINALGDANPGTLTTVNNLASVLNRSGRYEDAVELLLEHEASARQVWVGHAKRWLANYLAKLGEACTGTGAYADAEATLLEAYPLLIDGFGETHIATTRCIQRLVALYTAWHASEPDGGHDAERDAWIARLTDR